MKPEQLAAVRREYADLKKRVAALVQTRKELSALVRNRAPDSFPDSFKDENQRIADWRGATRKDTSRVIHDLWPLLDELEGIDFVKAASLKRDLDAFILNERPISRTEFEWETDRVLDLDVLIGQVGTSFPEPERQDSRTIAPPKVVNQCVSPIQVPEGATWSDVKIEFVNDHTVRLEVREANAVRDYATAGFDDRRTSKPVLSWFMLLRLATHQSIRRPESRINKVEKTVSDLRKRLRKLIPIDGDPLPFDRKRNKSYHPIFRIILGRTYHP